MFTFITEVRSELAKVTWPDKGDVIKLTLLVIGISLAVGLYLGGLDVLFTEMLKFLIS